MNYASYTKYPEVYIRSYWGRFEGHPGNDVIEARNKFAEKYGLVVVSKPLSIDKIRGEFRRTEEGTLDHQEFYEDKLGRIVHVYSGNWSRPESWSSDLHPLFKQIPPMYRDSLPTACRIVESIRSKNILIKMLKQKFSRLPDEIVSLIKIFLLEKKRKREEDKDKLNVSRLF
jgi:hypothetical protein